MPFESETNEQSILIKSTSLPPVGVIESDEQLIPNDKCPFGTRAKVLLCPDKLAESQAGIVRRFDESLFETCSRGKLQRCN